MLANIYLVANDNLILAFFLSKSGRANGSVKLSIWTIYFNILLGYLCCGQEVNGVRGLEICVVLFLVKNTCFMEGLFYLEISLCLFLPPEVEVHCSSITKYLVLTMLRAGILPEIFPSASLRV